MIVREALAGALSARVATALVAVVAGAMCAVALLMAGQAQANRAQAAQRLSAPEARVLSVTTTDGSGIVNPVTVQASRSLDSAVAVLGLSAPSDAVNSALGRGSTAVPLWEAIGDVRSAVTVVDGRWPEPGEAIASTTTASAFGLQGPAGGAELNSGRQIPIVGVYRPDEAFPALGAGILAVPDPQTTGPYASLHVPIDNVADAGSAQAAVLGILAPPDPSTITVRSPVGAARTALDLDRQLAEYARTQLVTVVGVGALLVAGVVLADVLIRSRDLGRRRTLGITRLDLVLLVCVRTGIAAGLGVVLGGGLTAAVLRDQVRLEGVVGVAVVTTASAVLAAVLPSVFAAHRDPVRVMRTA